MASIRHCQAAAAGLFALGVALPAFAAANQPAPGFGETIAFTPNSYTPPGITSLVYSPLASQNQSGFGEAIVFTASAYTPAGITSLVYSSLASLDRAGFGEAIAFAPASYTPQGPASPRLLDTAAIQ